MNKPLHSLLCLAVVVLYIVGFVCLHTATTNGYVAEVARTPSLIGAVTCLVLATGLLVTGVLAFRKRDQGP